MLEAGTTLLHYRILDKIGEGGMGDVYRGEDTRLGRSVALKVLPPEMASSPDRLRRFQQEARTVAALNHPNIVTLFSVEQAGAVHFLTMELVEGHALDALLPAEGFALETLLELAIPIADALATANDHGIVHRDLKTANVMVADDGMRVKVLDFGLAKLAASDSATAGMDAATRTATQAGMILGTPHYMSPEQARAEPVDHRSDIFSLGVMLFEMAVGQRPFKGNSSIELLSSVLKDAAPAVSEVKPQLPRHLGRVIGRCLEKDPADRYQSARDVCNELQALRRESTDGVAAHVEGDGRDAERSWRWPAMLGGALVVVMLAAGFWIWTSGTRESMAPGPASIAPTASAASETRSVAVLPFTDLSPGGDQEYLGDGITEEILSRLARVDGLRVASRSSSFYFKGRSLEVTEVAGKLGVSNVLEGSVQLVGGALAGEGAVGECQGRLPALVGELRS